MTTPSGRDAGEVSTRLGIPIHWTRQFLAGLIGLAALIVGTLAVFETNLEAGPVALLAVGAIFLYVGLAGLMPTRVKIGGNELDWSKAIDRIEQTTPEVSKELRAAGVAEDEILPGNIKLNASEQVALAAKINSLSRDVKEVSDAVGPRHVPPAALLQLARGCAAQRMWIEAARYYDLYIEQVPADWEAQFARGVAHANSRMGDSSDRAALDAYDAAIAHKPDDVSARITSRLFTYRGAMKKRLKMLRQAEADAVLGKAWHQIHAGMNGLTRPTI